MNKKINLGIYLFDEVEVLDFAGTFEVFSLAENMGEKLFHVLTIGETGEMISARNGLKVQPDYHFSNHPALDILIIPGGYGAEEIEIKKLPVLEWIRSQKSQVQILASVCTGAFLLAEAGLLKNRVVTTHWMDLDRLEKEYKDLNVIRNQKFVDQDDIITSGGISAGINMAFHMVKRLFGTEVAAATAKRMEYDIELEA